MALIQNEDNKCPTTKQVNDALKSMVVYPIAGAIRNVALFGNSVIGSNIYVAFLLNNVKNMKHYSNYETDRLIIGTNQNIPVQGLLAVMCINNT